MVPFYILVLVFLFALSFDFDLAFILFVWSNANQFRVKYNNHNAGSFSITYFELHLAKNFGNLSIWQFILATCHSDFFDFWMYSEPGNSPENDSYPGGLEPPPLKFFWSISKGDKSKEKRGKNGKIYKILIVSISL